MKLKWNRSVDGYTDSKDGRFSIYPLPYGSSYAQGYDLDDKQTGKRYNADTQGQAKRTAQRIVDTGKPW